MATRVATAGTHNSGDLISAADINNMPGGTIGFQEKTSNSTGTTTIETVCTVSPTVGTSREITVMGTANVRATGACNAQVGLYQDSVQIQRKNVPIPATTTDVPVALFVRVNGPASGAHTYELTTGLSGTPTQTVTCVNNGGAGTLGTTQLLVVDSGPSFS